jgi:hypothetical protein
MYGRIYVYFFLGLVCFPYLCLHDLVMLVYGVFGMGFLHIGVFCMGYGHIDTCLFPTVLITCNHVFLTSVLSILVRININLHVKTDTILVTS